MKLKRFFATCMLAIAVSAMAWATNVVVDGTNVRLRLGPSTSYNMLTDAKGNTVYVNKGDVLEYVATCDNFYKVKFNGKTVYVSRDYSHLSNEKTQVVVDLKPTTAIDKMLVGKHMLSMQWISWEYFGECYITKVDNNRYRCTGQQLSREQEGDYVKIDGFLSADDEFNLTFEGTIKTKVYHINNGQEYVRDGQFHFKSTNGRKYWRLMEMDGSDGQVDYIDIYMFRNNK